MDSLDGKVPYTLRDKVIDGKLYVEQGIIAGCAGGGTAGCYAAITISEKSPETQVLICEKAHIKRSGCLAAGVNALNAYITEGRKPQDYVDYAKKDADGIVREDLLLTMGERLNAVTARLEELGLVILKDENGHYARANKAINGQLYLYD